jgi:hypothetical protein
MAVFVVGTFRVPSNLAVTCGKLSVTAERHAERAATGRHAGREYYECSAGGLAGDGLRLTLTW